MRISNQFEIVRVRTGGTHAGQSGRLGHGQTDSERLDVGESAGQTDRVSGVRSCSALSPMSSLSACINRGWLQ